MIFCFSRGNRRAALQEHVGFLLFRAMRYSAALDI